MKDNNLVIDNTLNSNDIHGLVLWESDYNNITGNTANQNDDMGIWVLGYYNDIIGNFVRNSSYGIIIHSYSNHTTICDNTIMNSEIGMVLTDSWHNIIYHNNLIDSIFSQISLWSSENYWDSNGEGNYWDDYLGLDENIDGIGDTPYEIDESNQDNYPLMEPFGTQETVFNVTVEEVTVPVGIITNSSISEFIFSQTAQQISFNVTGPTGTIGCCEIAIPLELQSGEFSIYLDEMLLLKDIDYTETSNSTHTIFNITYEHSTHAIEIFSTTVIPELTSLVTLVTFITTTMTVLVYGKKSSRKRRG